MSKQTKDTVKRLVNRMGGRAFVHYYGVLKDYPEADIETLASSCEWQKWTNNSKNCRCSVAKRIMRSNLQHEALEFVSNQRNQKPDVIALAKDYLSKI